MEGPRAARVDELESVIGLINRVFRTSRGHAPSMGEEFPLLLCHDNIDNMRIFSDEGNPVAAVNYYPSNILIESCFVKAASIGAVCTDDKYRGKNLASGLMDDAEARMKTENVDVMLVSGTRSLYLRRGCSIVGGFVNARLTAKESYSSDVEVIDFDQSYIEDMMRLYSKEPVKYYRTRYEFEKLLQGGTTPWADLAYRVFVLKKSEEFAAYIVIKMNNEKSWIEVKECAGNREVIYNGLYKIMSMYSLPFVELYLSYCDHIVPYLKQDNIEIKPQNQLGTVKIINFESLMDNLKPYFSQYVSSEMMSSLDFSEENGKYIISVDNEKIEISEMEIITQIIFGQNATSQIESVLENELKDKPAMRQFLNSVFPVPFPWAGNLNFI